MSERNVDRRGPSKNQIRLATLILLGVPLGTEIYLYQRLENRMDRIEWQMHEIGRQIDELEQGVENIRKKLEELEKVAPESTPASNSVPPPDSVPTS